MIDPFLISVEEAIAFSKFRDEFSMTHDEIAHMLGRSRVSVTNILRLLSLESRVMQMLVERKIDMGHARALACARATIPISVNDR